LPHPTLFAAFDLCPTALIPAAIQPATQLDSNSVSREPIQKLRVVSRSPAGALSADAFSFYLFEHAEGGFLSLEKSV